MRSKAGATCYLPVVSRDETHIFSEVVRRFKLQVIKKRFLFLTHCYIQWEGKMCVCFLENCSVAKKNFGPIFQAALIFLGFTFFRSLFVDSRTFW